MISFVSFLHQGRKEKEYLHSTSLCGNPLQSKDFTYNARGWLTHINNVDLSNQGNSAGSTNNDANDLWGMELAYTTPTASLGGVALYNGNISEKRWVSKTDNIKRYYTFTYDERSRLKNAAYNEWNGTSFVNNNRYQEGNISYDENGGITSLTRQGLVTGTSTFGTMDQLTYTYNGNQLTKVEDAIMSNVNDASINDFKNKVNVATEYAYDVNGNLTQDLNKGINNIIYNRFNLPTSIDFGGNNRIEYIYGSDGTKLCKKKVENNVVTNTTWYCGKFIYTGNTLDYFFTSEGRAVKTATTPVYRYEYNYKDQTGNVTLSFSDINNDGVVATNEVIQQTHYYPFGLDFYGTGAAQIGAVNPYKYSGKEIQSDFNLNLYDFGARFYNPVTPGWTSADPMADQRYEWSPYNYCRNNPNMNVDPTGALDDWVQNNETGEYVWMDNVTSANNTPEGYKYIGAKDEDILEDLGVNYNCPEQSANRIGFVASDAEEGQYAVATMVNVKAKSNVTIAADVSYKVGGLPNNVMGRQFNGIRVSGTVVSSSSEVDGTVETYSTLSVTYGGKNYKSPLTTPASPSVKQEGTEVAVASISIPASTLNSSKAFTNINISGAWWVTNSADLRTPVIYHGVVPIPQTFKHNWIFPKK